MEIRIMTFEGASETRRDNADKISKYLDGTVYVGGTNTLDNFMAICHSVGDDDLLYLEDDVKLCSRFIPRIKESLREFPNRMISYFYPLYSPACPLEVNFSKQSFSQCLFIPNQIVKELIQVEPEFRPKFYKNDWEKIFRELNGWYIRYYPHLVQQLDLKSEIFNDYFHFQSEYFIEDLYEHTS